MKAIILAAGKGTRISRYLEGNPKCTVDIGGQRLIRYTVDLLKAHGITDIILSVGYNHSAIERVLDGDNCLFCFNPFFDVTNSIASIWFARNYLVPDDDYLLMNGDVFIEERILEKVLSSTKTPILFADSNRIQEADYRFGWQNGMLTKFGKQLTNEETNGEYIGLGLIRKDFVQTFKGRLDAMIEAQRYTDWWENVLYSMVGELPVYVEDLNGLFWAEVDYIEDYERILAYRGKSLADVEGVHLNGA